jgi:3-oxoadipate enol-lactonase
MWDPQRDSIRDGVMIEYPGHGAAPLAPVDGMAGLAQRVLDAVPGRFSFVGLSLGGAVGIQLAADHPDRVQRLVLACTSLRFGEPAQWVERAATVRRDGLGAIVDAVMARWFTSSFADVEPYREMFLSVDAEGYARCCDALADWDGTDAVARIEAPTLVVAGSLDPTSPPEHCREIAARVRAAELALIADAAHLPNVERPEMFNLLLEEFL